MAETKEKAAKAPKGGAGPAKGGKDKGGAGYATDPAP